MDKTAERGVKRSAGSNRKPPEVARAEAFPKAVEDLSPAEAKDEHEYLVREIERHDRLYYQDDQPEISDAEYDGLRLRLDALEQRFPELLTADSPSLAVGAPPSAKFAKVSTLSGCFRSATCS